MIRAAAFAGRTRERAQGITQYPQGRRIGETGCCVKAYSSVFSYFVINRTPSVLGPQWVEMVQLALVM